MNILAPSLFSLIFLGIGGAIVAYARRVAAKARQSLSWPSVDGQIVHAAVLLETNRSGNGQNTAYYKADISYRYKIGGKDFSSSTITLADMSSTTARAQGIVERYPDRSTVRVYYNPANFSESVLEPGPTTGVNVLYLVGGIFAAGGLFFLAMSLTGHVRVG